MKMCVSSTVTIYAVEKRIGRRHLFTPFCDSTVPIKPEMSPDAPEVVRVGVKRKLHHVIRVYQPLFGIHQFSGIRIAAFVLPVVLIAVIRSKPTARHDPPRTVYPRKLFPDLPQPYFIGCRSDAISPLWAKLGKVFGSWKRFPSERRAHAVQFRFSFGKRRLWLQPDDIGYWSTADNC